jgi:hypothetical protein
VYPIKKIMEAQMNKQKNENGSKTNDRLKSIRIHRAIAQKCAIKESQAIVKYFFMSYSKLINYI